MIYNNGKFKATIFYKYIDDSDKNIYESYYYADNREKLIKECRKSFEVRCKMYKVTQILINDTEDITKEVLTHKKKRNNKLGKLKIEKKFKDTIDENVLNEVELVSEIKEVVSDTKKDVDEYWD